MANFTINFQANTTGDHYVGYRTYNDPVNTYTVETVNVLVPGPQSVQIDIPGNLYCFEIEYTGYVIAACQPQTDANSDGIPDTATTWSVVVNQQQDPCKLYNISCDALPIGSVTIDNDGGFGCGIFGNETYPLVITENPSFIGSEIIPADIDVVLVGGVVTTIVINNPGAYTEVPTITLGTIGCNSLPTFTAVLAATCRPFNLDNFKCATSVTVSGTTIYNLALGESMEFCADGGSIELMPAEYTKTNVDNCHCKACEQVTITAPGATSGVGQFTYQTCWDGNNPNGEIVLYTQEFNGGIDVTINLGCIIVDTLTVLDGTLDQPMVVTTGPCP